MTTKNLQDVIYYLQGTCNSLEKAEEEYFGRELTLEECQDLDLVIFQCSNCDWWMEINEMSENTDWVCRECTNED